MTRWTAALATLAVLGLAVAAVQFLAPLSRPDFPPFVMTIEQWDKVRVGYSDGRTVGGTSVYRIDYQRRDDWTSTLVSDEVSPEDPGGHGYGCRDGTYGYVEAGGKFTATETHSDNCNGIGRWIHYGIASSLSSPWKRESADGRVTYALTGERIVFDLATGLPLLYEAGLTTGSVGHREVFRTDRTASSAEVATCLSTGYTGSVVGAFTVRAADLAQQDETRGGPNGPRPLPSRFRDFAPDASIVLCFFDGFIPASQVRLLPPATPLPPYDRYAVTVDPSGQGQLVVAGYRDRIVVAPQLP